MAYTAEFPSQPQATTSVRPALGPDAPTRPAHTMLTFVLVSGSWFPPGLVWEPVKAALEADGHRVFIPTLPGRLPGEDRREVTQDAYVAAVLGVFDRYALTHAQLVVWSMSGTLVPQILEGLMRRGDPQALARIIFWNAFVPAPGASLFDSLEAAKPGMSAVFAGMLNPTTGGLPLAEPMLRAMLAPDDTPDQVRYWSAILGDEPGAPLRARLDNAAFYDLLFRRGPCAPAATEAPATAATAAAETIGARFTAIPIVALHGEDDAVMDVMLELPPHTFWRQELTRLGPAATWFHVPSGKGGGHLMQWTRPLEFATVLEHVCGVAHSPLVRTGAGETPSAVPIAVAGTVAVPATLP